MSPFRNNLYRYLPLYIHSRQIWILLYLHYYLQFSFGQLLTILLMKSLFPLQPFWLLPWQCKQWEEEEEWRALTSLLDPPPPFRPFCQEQLHCWDMRVVFFFFGSTEWEAQVVQAPSTVIFWQSAYSVTLHGLKKKKSETITQHFAKMSCDWPATCTALSLI